MRKYNQQTSYQTLSRTGSSNKSRSQNHYYIQANQFQKRYQNTLFNSYKLNSSRKCPPCCNAQNGNDSAFQSQMTFNNNNQNQNYTSRKNLTQINNQYYHDSYQYQNKNVYQDSKINLQNSKRYLEELLQKSQLNLKAYKQKAENQIQSLEKIIQNKNDEILVLNKQINMLKKISMQSMPKSINQSHIKHDQSSLVQLQSKQQSIKQLQRKIARLRQQNSYFREDLQIKNKQIEQLKQKYKSKEQNDTKIIQLMQKELRQSKQGKQVILQKYLQLQKMKEQDEKEIDKKKQIQRQLQIVKIKFSQMKQSSDKNFQRNMDKIRTFENQFKVLRERSQQKDMQIQGLISKITCIQSELDFFKDKFTNLLFEIQREERESATIYQKALSLKENGQKIYQEIQKIRQSQIIQLNSNKNSHRSVAHTMVDPTQHLMFQSHIYSRAGLGRQTIFKNLHNTNQQDRMIQSNDFNYMNNLNRFPSLTNMSISPIRNNNNR